MYDSPPLSHLDFRPLTLHYKPRKTGKSISYTAGGQAERALPYDMEVSKRISPEILKIPSHKSDFVITATIILPFFSYEAWSRLLSSILDPQEALFLISLYLCYFQTPSKIYDDDAWKEKVASFYGSMDEMSRADGRDIWLYLVKACKKFPAGRRWTSKSTGPQSHRFFRPGVTCKKNHIRGKDFFDGYDELKSFIVREVRGMLQDICNSYLLMVKSGISWHMKFFGVQCFQCI